MPQQKALVIMEAKAPFTLSRTWPIPKPGPGEILIKIKASALNPVEWKQQKEGFIIEKYPSILGLDIAGDVEELGEGVKGYSKGDRVFAAGDWRNEAAGYQEYCVIPSDLLVKIPPNLDYAQASTIPVGYFTAAVGLLAPAGAGLNPTLDPAVNFVGQPAFVFGGGSCVGQFAIQILRVLGYSKIITYASGKHTELLKFLGATHVIDRKTVSTADVPAAVKKIAGAPIKIVYDAVSEGDTRDASFATLAEGGIALAVIPGDDRNVEGKTLKSFYFSPHFHRDFGVLAWKTLEKQLADGIIVPNRVEKLPNGLAGVADGLKRHEEHLGQAWSAAYGHGKQNLQLPPGFA
ncbi:chaperonin 10-like protein [Mycena galericulata]|nr:chaperonin 10-like protein [Mycena galericulata]